MKQTTLHFHIGRGGRFNNPGHRSFKGTTPLHQIVKDHYADVFNSFENEDDALTHVQGNKEWQELLREAVGSRDSSKFEQVTGFKLGEAVLIDSTGHILISAKESEGLTGRIEWDGDFDTDEVIFLEEASAADIRKVLNSKIYGSLELVQEWIEMQLNGQQIDWSRIEEERYSDIIELIDCYLPVEIEEYYTAEQE